MNIHSPLGKPVSVHVECGTVGKRHFRGRFLKTKAPKTALKDRPGTRDGGKYHRILDAALEVIAENGFFRSPVSAIAQRAGVADGTIYLYFNSKDQILRTAIDEAFSRFFTRVHEEMAGVEDAKEQLRILARLHLETLAANRSLAIVMQTEVRQSARFIEEFSREHMAQYLNIVREAVRRGQQQGVFRGDLSDRTVAHCLTGALDETVSSWVFTERPFVPGTTADQILDVIISGIKTEQSHA